MPAHCYVYFVCSNLGAQRHGRETAGSLEAKLEGSIERHFLTCHMTAVRQTIALEIRRSRKMALDKPPEDRIQQIYFEHLTMAHRTTST